MANKVPSNAQWTDLVNRIKDKASIADLQDLLYPVGSYYVTSDLTFDPSTFWGGNWEISDQVTTAGGEVWSSIGEVWDSVGGQWELDGVIVNRWHRIADSGSGS